MELPEKQLPKHVTALASLSGNEYAWAVEDIPTVIEAAKAANLVNIGGQLQFRIPKVGTCECYWVEVDTYKEVPTNLTWAERVSATAAAAQPQFQNLCNRYDFVAEGRSAFGAYLANLEDGGGDINKAICFVWYVESHGEAAARQE